MSHRTSLLLLAAFVLCPTAHAWTVIHKGESAAGPFVIIDAGKNDGITADSRLCVVDADGEAIGCGPVQSLRPTATGILLTREEHGLVPLGALARLDGDEAEGRSGAGVWRSRMSFRILSPLAQPAIYDTVRFNGGARTDVTAPTWVKVGTVTAGAWGLAASWEKPLGDSLAVSPGVFLSVNNDVDNRSQLAPVIDSATISALTRGEYFGLKCDLDWKALAVGDFLLQTGGGLAFVDSAVSVHARYLDDGDNRSIARYESQLLALALQGDVETHFSYGDLALFAAFRVSQPLATLADSYEGETDFDGVDLGDASYKVSALHAAVRHRTALGYGLELGASYAF